MMFLDFLMILLDTVAVLVFFLFIFKLYKILAFKSSFNTLEDYVEQPGGFHLVQVDDFQKLVFSGGLAP